MTSIFTNPRLRLFGLRNLIRATARRAKHPRISAAYRQWAARYRGFAQRRFARFSRGGGDWAPLAPATIARRRATTASILRDTGTMFAALDPRVNDNPGYIEQELPDGIEVGFGGPHRHPDGDGVTIADIARFHHSGNLSGGLPAREIIVEPDQQTRRLMGDDMRRAVAAVKREGEQ